MKEPRTTLDYTINDPYVEMPVEVVKNQVYEVLQKWEAQRDGFLDKVKENLKDLDSAVILMVSVSVGNSLVGDLGLAQDSLKRASDLTKNISRLKTFAAQLQALSPNDTVKLTFDQAQNWNL